MARIFSHTGCHEPFLLPPTRELQRSLPEAEARFAGPGMSIEQLALRYLHEGLADPRPVRLMLWRGLDAGADPPPDDTSAIEDLTRMRQRQARGELADDLDAGFLRLALMSVVMAPMMMPHMTEKIFGLPPGAPEFGERYGEQLRRILRHLRGPGEQPRPAP